MPRKRIRVHCAHEKMVDMRKLRPNPRNPNTHPRVQVELLARIIREAMRARGRVDALRETAEDMRDNPGEYFPAKMRADKALKDWQAAYPEAAAEVIAEQKAWREAEKARKEREYKESFVGRGLD